MAGRQLDALRTASAAGVNVVLTAVVKASLDSKGRPERLPGIEGMRALAATSVVLFHVWRYGAPDGAVYDLGAWTAFMPHLALGVTLFFTLSGFLLYRPFAAAILESTELPSVRRYLRNRALRIIPAYWVILLLVGLVLNGAIIPDPAPGLQIGSLAGELGVLGASMLFLQSYTPWTLYAGIGPAWSLCVEIVFYVCLPALAMVGAYVAARRSSSSRVWAALLPAGVLLLIGLSGKMIAAFASLPSPADADDSWHAVLAQSFVAQADLFAGGMTLAVIVAIVRRRRLTMGGRHSIAVLGLALLVGATALSISGLSPVGPFLYQTLMAVCFTLLLAVVVLPSHEGSLGSTICRLLDARAIVIVGLASYSLFLWHEPLVHVLRENSLTAPGVGGFLVALLAVGAVSIALALLTYRFVELPALARKGSRSRRPMPIEQRKAAP